MLSVLKQSIWLTVLLTLVSFSGHSQWTQTNLQNGGSADRMISFNGGLYMSVNNYGIYKSLDNGDNWTKTGPAGTYEIVKHKNQLLAFSPGFMYKSLDGITWTDTTAPMGVFFWDVASDNNTIILSALNGVYLSDNDGTSWANIGGAIPSIGDFRSIAIKGSDFYIGGFNGKLFKSVNHGLSWTQITLHVAYAVKQIFTTASTIFLNVEMDGILRSRDDGATWENVAKNDLLLSTEYLHQIYVEGNSIYAASAGNNVYASMNEGASWVLAKSKTNWFNIATLTATSNHFFMATIGGGVFRNNKLIDAVWEVKNNGLYFADVYDIVVRGNNEIFVGTENTFVQSSTNEGNSWNQLKDMYGFSGQNSRSLITYKDYLFSGSGGSGIQRSEDGLQWSGMNLGLVSRIISGIAATNEFIFTGTNDGIYRSSDLGALWKKSNDGIQGNIRTVYSFNNNILAGSNSGLFFSSDQGVTWRKISTGLPSENIAKVFQTGTDIYVSTQTGVFKTSNLGESWRQVYNGFVSCLTGYKDNIFIGSSGGSIVMSSDGGESWTQVGGQLPLGYIQAISFTKDHILTGLYQYGTGIWRRKIGEIVPPTIVYTTRKDNANFYVGEAFKITSDQTLRGQGGTVLNNTTIQNYIVIKDSKNQIVNFSANVDPTSKFIEVIIDAKPGENYTSTIKFENEFGIAIKSSTTHGFTAFPNSRPIVSDDQVLIPNNTSFNFSEGYFMRSYKDDHDELISIVVKTVPTHGQLLLNGTQKKIGDEIGKANLGALTYSPEPQFTGIDKFSWSGFDGQYYSTIDATITIEVVAITEVEDQRTDHFLIYPNPFSDEIVIQSPNKEFESYEIRILNSLGEKIKTLTFNKSGLERNVSLKELTAGIYFIEFIAPNFESRKKIVKQ